MTTATETRCWMVCDGQIAMLCHSETRTKAILQFINRYTDAYPSDYFNGDFRLNVYRVPEFDGQPEQDYASVAAAERGLEVWCERCECERVVGAPIERWGPAGWTDDLRLGYAVDGRVYCYECVEHYGLHGAPIKVSWSFQTGFERYRDEMEANL